MAGDRYTLYYFPSSYYSQKVLVALFEKDANFRRRTIDIQNGYQYEPWYMKLNPNGTVPTLQRGDKILTDSEDILRYLDKQIKTGPTLLPDPASPVGKEVEEWFRKLQELKVESITFGVLRNPELSISGPKIPGVMITEEALKKRLQKTKEMLQSCTEKYPDMKEVYLRKLEAKKGFFSGEDSNKDLVKKILDDLDQLFDQIEIQLKKTMEVQGSSNCWLIGPQFTAADITLTVFLDRLDMLGVLDRFVGESKRPLLFDYYQRVGKKTSVQKNRAQIKDMIKVMLGSKVKKAFPKVFGMTVLVVAIGVGFYFWKNK